MHSFFPGGMLFAFQSYSTFIANEPIQTQMRLWYWQMGYELRASGVKEELEELFSRHFVIKKIPHSKVSLTSGLSRF